MYGTLIDKTRRGIAGFVVRRKYAKLATLFIQLKNFHPHPPPIVQRDDITNGSIAQAFGFGFGDGDRDKLSFHPLREVARGAEGEDGVVHVRIAAIASRNAVSLRAAIVTKWHASIPIESSSDFVTPTKRALVLGFHFSTLRQ